MMLSEMALIIPFIPISHDNKLTLEGNMHSKKTSKKKNITSNLKTSFLHEAKSLKDSDFLKRLRFHPQKLNFIPCVPKK